MVRYAIQEPPKRRLRIKNKIRFIVFILLVVLTILVFVIPRQEGHSNSEYKPYKVAFGDTYWHIARQLQEAGYRPRADIREIVYELVELSGIKAHELKEGDIILVPDLEELK